MKSTLSAIAILAATVSVAACQQAPAPAQSAATSKPAPTTISTPPQHVPMTPKDPASTLKLQLALQTRKALALEQQQIYTEANAKLQAKAAEIEVQDKIATDEVLRIRKDNGWGDDIQWDAASSQFVKVVKPEPTKK